MATASDSNDNETCYQNRSGDTNDVNNPLLLEVVVRNVLSYLDQEDLKICRLVNSFWNQLTTPYMKKVCGNISFNSDNYWTNITNHDIDAMARFNECVAASTNFPFSKLDVGTSVIKDPSHEIVLTNFFRNTGPFVTELIIRDECGQSLYSEELPETIKFPALATLTVHIIQTITNDEDARSNFEFITSVIENAPSLDRLELVDHNGMDGKAVTHMLNSMEKANCKKISRLNIAGQIENEHLAQMSTLGLTLKYLFLDFWGSAIDSDSLKGFLENQSNTVEEIKIADFAMSSNFTVQFPRMKKVKTLMVQGSMLGRICISFPNISYLSQFPVLRRLSFSNVMDEWDEFLKFGIQPTETVEELKLPGDFADVTGLLHAARLFPKIKKLEVPAVLNIVNAVCEVMPNIEELILNTKYVDLVDDIITGLKLEECEEMRHFTQRMFKSLEEEHLSIATTKPISCLQRLKILRLKCKRQFAPVEITDVSCRLVLMKLKSLECLDFWGRDPPMNRISQNVLRDMRKQFLVLC